jgi:hypothetical protein
MTGGGDDIYCRSQSSHSFAHLQLSEWRLSSCWRVNNEGDWFLYNKEGLKNLPVTNHIAEQSTNHQPGFGACYPL